MRHSKALDYWKAVKKGCSFYSIDQVNYRTLPGIGTAKIRFTSSINAVCGKNGLGKSTILRAIASCLDSSFKEKFKNTNTRVGDNSFLVRVADQKGGSHIYNYSDLNEFSNLVFIDSAELCQNHLALLKAEDNLGEALDQVEFGVLGAKDQVEIKRILGREYSSIEFAELEDIVDWTTVPYFRVTRNDVVYESPDMALGELSILTLFWVIAQGNEPRVVLLEEPENFLTPQAQRYVCDYLAYTAVKRNDWYLISTHSEHIVESVGLHSTQVLVEGDVDSPVTVKSPRHSFEYLQHLGLSPRKKGIVLVEDTAAKVAIDTACHHFGSFIKQDYEVIKIGGTSEITALLKNFPKGSEFSMFGLFDGNERSKISLPDDISYSFLPSNYCPEEALRILVSESPNAFLSFLGTTPDRLRAALSVATGEDPHDWLESLSANMDMNYPECLKALCRGWVASNEEDFASILHEIDASELHYSILEESRQRSKSFKSDPCFQGRIVFYNNEKKFGFIESDQNGTLFFHISFFEEGANIEQVREGAKVGFTIEEVQEKPKNNAINITLMH